MALCVAALLLAPWWPLLLAWPGAYACALAAVSLQLAWRERSACGLLAGAAAATMHGAWALGFVVGLATLRERAWAPQLAVPLWTDRTPVGERA